MELTRNNLRIEWIDLGEGLHGDYEPDNPEDIHLLRFDLYENIYGEWEMVDDCSYCTLMPLDTPDNILMKGLEYLMEEFTNAICGGYSGKKTGERLSWISPDWFE